MKKNSIAMISNFGTDGIVDYMTVAIQDGGVKHGGRIIESNVFRREAFACGEDMALAAITWAKSFGISKVMMSPDLGKPETCSCCGDPTIRVYD